MKRRTRPKPKITPRQIAYLTKLGKITGERVDVNPNRNRRNVSKDITRLAELARAGKRARPARRGPKLSPEAQELRARYQRMQAGH